MNVGTLPEWKPSKAVQPKLGPLDHNDRHCCRGDEDDHDVGIDEDDDDHEDHDDHDDHDDNNEDDDDTCNGWPHITHWKHPRWKI